MRTLLLLVIAAFTFTQGMAQSKTIENTVKERLETYFKEYKTDLAEIGTCKLDSFSLNMKKKKLIIIKTIEKEYEKNF